MRKLAVAVLCVLLVLCLCACQNGQNQSNTEPTEPQTADSASVQTQDTNAFTFPEGTVLCGQDLSGMLGHNAYMLLREAVENYTLNLKVNDQQVLLTAQDMSLQFDEDVMAEYVNAIKNGQDPAAYMPVTYNPKQLKSRIAVSVNVLPQNVSLAYDTDANTFVFTDPVPGTAYNLEPVMDDLDSAIMCFTPECSVTVTSSETPAVITADSDRAIAAQEAANSILRTALTYTYTPDGSKTSYESLTIDNVGSFIRFDSNLKPCVDMNAVNAYAAQMDTYFSVGKNDGKFLTSMGEYIDFEIYYADQLVDTAALAEDIAYCIENGISGVRVAPYLPAEEEGYLHDFGGNYVEVDLTQQCLWVYNNYECVMHSPIVTGSLGNGWGTPNGAYNVVYKEIGATLMGLDVTYWMPFYGNYGLHDAPWRRVFDDDEYLFNGSHGCVNIPPANARTVFYNVSWGTPVIVHGGAHYGHPVVQELYATTEYHVGVNAGTFALDATPKYGSKSRLTYTCDNTDVLTVSKKGEVTVVSAGTAKITIETPDWDFCPSVKKIVTITVHESCSEQGHMVVNWKTTSAPTCSINGSESGTCSACGYAVSRSVPASHNYDDWETVTAPTCTEDGLEQHVCLDCGKTETQTVAATGHSYFGWEISEATPTKDGKKTATCYDCKKVYEESLPTA